MLKRMLHTLLNRVQSGVFEVTYWDGSTVQYGEGSPSTKIIFHAPIPYQKVLKDPILAFGEAYMDGLIDITGELDDIFKLINANKELIGQHQRRNVMQKIFFRQPLSTSLRQQQADIRHHYDLGNEFFSLWLDDTMSYSCAYFKRDEDTLTQAQIQKIDHVLKKLQLRPGETLLDIGSGWGWLIIRAAQLYGANTVGITLSREQYEETRRRIAALGLTGQVTVELLDYRELAQKGYTFDKIASIGMLEHVGAANLPLFMQALKKLLKAGGLVLLHTITHTKEGPVNTWIEKYIFPGGYIPSLREVIWLLPDYDFHTIDVESLRLHYAKTLDRWSAGFEKHVDKVRDMYDERFVRMWRLYLRSCAASFRVSGLNVHQILFSNGLNNSLPMTRQHLYS